MSLDEYRRRRAPSRTPEPFGDGAASGDRPRFVIQRHASRRLHYDFRLERDGALASWAVPKGVPLRRGERHLAVHVEDHPLEYADFEGTIPAGEYGAGTVEIWDRGRYELVEEKRDGGLTVRLHGRRLDGVWTLVPAHLDGDPKNWLLLRKDAADERGVRYAPMLATSSDALPSGDGWVYEPKWDGYRAIVTLSGAEVTLTSRNGNDLTERFREVARAAAHGIGSSDAVLDGEICALDEHGRARFSLLQEGGGTLSLVLFDLLELDSEPLLEEPLRERRKRLERLVREGGQVLVSPQFDDGEALLAAARTQELEGVVAKRLDSTYRPGRRSTDWHKVKLRQTQEVVVVGYTRGQGRRSGGFGALVVAVHEAGGLRWAGNVGTGFSDAEIERLCGLLKPLERDVAPLAEVPKMPRVRRSDVVWVEPRLVAEVEFTEWTHERRLRAPVYVRLREDKPAREVRRERAALPPVLQRGRRELRLSNLDKPFWPAEGITKGDLIAYYRDIAHVLVPHLHGRPFTMKRYPDGWQGKNFFQKQAPSHMPPWIRRAPFPASTREGEKKIIDYALVNDELALLWMANMGCIDLHTWASRADKPERPDWVMFDLDPSEGVGFEEVIEVARLVKQILDLLELESFPKTSGSRGIHVLVPIARRHSFADVRHFAAIAAGALARAHPGLVTTEWARQKRRGVLVDANQNGPGKTNASVYSVRPRAGAPVSTPLRWEEVVPGLDPSVFTMDTVLDRVAHDGDLFSGVLEGKQSLAKALRALT
ncbi:MAG TPA: DNA ligase D [Gaiellaceae bacterium]|nr:DNA ligase D [Gaiellaceae bacterium]